MQHEFKKLFKDGETAFLGALYDALMEFGSIKDSHHEFDLKVSQEVSVAETASNPISLRFLQLLTLLRNQRVFWKLILLSGCLL